MQSPLLLTDFPFLFYWLSANVLWEENGQSCFWELAGLLLKATRKRASGFQPNKKQVEYDERIWSGRGARQWLFGMKKDVDSNPKPYETEARIPKAKTKTQTLNLNPERSRLAASTSINPKL